MGVGIMAALTKFLGNPKSVKYFAKGMMAGKDIADKSEGLSKFAEVLNKLMKPFEIIAVPLEVLASSLQDESVESALKIMNVLMKQLEDPTVKLVFETMGQMFFDMKSSTAEFIDANFELGRFLEGIGKITKQIFLTADGVNRLVIALEYLEARAQSIADVFEVPTTDTSNVQYTDPNYEEGQTEEEYAEAIYQDFVGF